MEYRCSCCNYVSDKRRYIVRHIQKKVSCGEGEKGIIEVPITIKCDYCDKRFASGETLNKHIKKVCTVKNSASVMLMEEIQKLKEELRNLSKNPSNVMINKKSNVTVNNQTIIINNYENTSMEKITDKIYNKIIKGSETYKIIPRLIKHIHFNPDIPENHNICISNLNNKYLSVFRNNHWEIENKNDEIGNLISDKETNISDWIAEKGDEYPQAKEKYDEYLEQKYGDEELCKTIRREVEMILYNNRHIVKK
jgi:ElaB/YqjD/DUF883 family membrane-anchored ribosome-binding protein